MARQRTPLWLLLAGALFLAYFALLMYCHVFRPVAVPAPAGVTRAELDAFHLRLPPGEPALDLARDGVLYALRAVQLVTLALGIAIATRRPRDPAALCAAWLLATAGVFSVALPAGWAAAWHALPALAGLPLWLPYVSTLAPGLILYLFAAHFTRHTRALSPAAIGALALIVAPAVIARTAARMGAVYGWPIAPTRWDAALPLLLTNAVPAAAAILLLARHYNRAGSVTEKRRARFVLTGGTAGLLAGAAVLLAVSASGPHPDRSMFASTSITAGTLLFLLFPASLAYAILRYRLFDLRGVIRLGLRYTVARRVLLSIVPLAAAALAFDIWSHGDRPLREIVTARSTFYVLLACGAMAAHLTRARWLDRLDRTFFRERYDATRILMDLVEELQAARPFEDLAAVAIARIEAALHPRFIVASTATAPGGPFATSAAFRPEKAPAIHDLSPTLMDAARALRRPMRVDASRVELLVPVVTQAGQMGAVMLLGAKRSEEPYAREDLDLLGAIASSLALRLSAAPAPIRLRDVELPRVIAGRYRLDRVIGRGGMGVVYEARDLTLDRRVAVKLMRDELLDAPEARRRFEDEARAAAGFSHPHVITIFDFAAPDAGSAMIVMELLEGRTLREELTGAPLPAARAVAIVRAVAGAVDAAHAQGLLHRDLKPENVFLTSGSGGERVKILDFGIARSFGPHAEGRTAVTLDGDMIGTPRYMAPEQLAGGPPAPSWDLWALGVMTFEMLTGAHPFGGPRPSQPPAPALDQFFARALAQQPADRFPSGHAFVAALVEAADAAAV